MDFSRYGALILRALRFWTRLPVPAQRFEVDPHAPPDMEALAVVSPVVGVVVGVIGGATLCLAASIGLGGMPGATLAVAAMILATGAMHEDALGDVADGFGGGATAERKLEIMKDPRLGSYGAIAIGLALLFKVSVLALLAAHFGAFHASVGLIGAAAMARIAGLWPLVALEAARANGLGSSAGKLSLDTWRQGLTVGATIGLFAALWLVGFSGVLAPLLAFALAFGVTRLAEQQIGGQTGDVCGAATQVAELAFLATLLTGVAG